MIGGHSFGGMLAVEVAMVLEEWGHEVECVAVMDSPLREQSRLVPDLTMDYATEEDMVEVMEMLIGALGAEAVGLGVGREHPRETVRWKAMTVSWLGTFAGEANLLAGDVYRVVLKPRAPKPWRCSLRRDVFGQRGQRPAA